MFQFMPRVANVGSGLEDDPYSLNWANDPVDGDPYFNFDWQASGVAVNPFGDSDLGTLWKELEAMKNTCGAGDNLQDIIATIIEIGKNSNDKANPTVQAFFAKYGKMFASLIDSELLLVYAKNAYNSTTGKFDMSNAWNGMASFASSLLNGPLSGVSASDPILGTLVAQLQSDTTQEARNQIEAEFWSNGTFQIPAGPGNPSQDGYAILLNDPDSYYAQFAQYVFSDVLYGGTFGDSAYANANNDLFMAMFIEVIQSSKNTFWVYMAAMAMFGMSKDQNYQDSLQGYAYITNWLTKHQGDLQKILNEYNTPGFFTGPDAAAHAKEWMDQVRQLFIDTEFMPYAGSLYGNIYSSEQNIFNTTDPYNPGDPTKTPPVQPTPIDNYYFPGSDQDYNALAKALNGLAQGDSSTTKPITPDTSIPNNLQTLTKTFTDRSQQTQTEMSSTSSNDNTVVNTMKTALSNITQLEQAANTQMSSSSSAT